MIIFLYSAGVQEFAERGLRQLNQLEEIINDGVENFEEKKLDMSKVKDCMQLYSKVRVAHIVNI